MAYIKGQFDVTQYIDINGDPATGYILKFFLTGTSTPTAIYFDSAGSASATSVTINSEGRWTNGGTEVDLFFDTGITYKAQLYLSDGTTTVGPTIDPYNVIPQGDTGADKEYASIAEFLASDTNTTFNIIYIQSYRAISFPDADGPAGGFFMHRTGSTGSAGTSGTGTDSGKHYDQDGTEFKVSLGQLVNPYQFGGYSDGSTSDLSALENMWNFAITQGAICDLLGRSWYIDDGEIADVPSGVICKNGKLLGVSHTTEPTSYLRIQGSKAAGVSIGTSITQGDTNFVVANSLTAGDLICIRDFPTDATDDYTESAANWNGEKTRSYANTSSSNLRQTRRKELAVVEASSGTDFDIHGGTLFDYTTSGLVFEEITPVKNVIFDGVDFENIYFMARYCKGVRVKNSNALASYFAIRESMSCHLQFDDFDAGNTKARIGVFDSSNSCSVKISGQALNISTDNALIKTNQAHNCIAEVASSGSTGATAFAVLVDTNYNENPTGYTDVPTVNPQVDVTANGFKYIFGALCDPYSAPIYNLNAKVTGRNGDTFLKGVFGGYLENNNPGEPLTIQGCTDLDIAGSFNLTETTFTDPRGTGTQNNERIDVDVSGTLTPEVYGASTGSGTVGGGTTVNEGWYSRKGDTILFGGRVDWTTHAAAAENLRLDLSDLPLNCHATYEGIITFTQLSGFTLTGGVDGKIDVSSKVGIMYAHGTGTSSQVAIPSSGSVRFGGFYKIVR